MSSATISSASAVSFEFAKKLVNAKDVMDMVQIQTDFVKAQTAALREQAKELGQTAT
ncbi:MAG: phasin family protein [Candidatus Binatus sp.]|uniref:phasin family protein n=1 Tax=Candidatus Binatus sp. TaxID=2811406 RepID=UPI003D13989C